jgi:hypothetical protein
MFAVFTVAGIDYVVQKIAGGHKVVIPVKSLPKLSCITASRTSQLQKRQYHSYHNIKLNANQSSMDRRSATSVDNDDDGDLSMWEFLTQRYDNGIMLGDEPSSANDTAGALPLDNFQRESLLPTHTSITFKRNRSETEPCASLESGEMEDRIQQRQRPLLQQPAIQDNTNHQQHHNEIIKISPITTDRSYDFTAMNPSWFSETYDNSVAAGIQLGRQLARSSNTFFQGRPEDGAASNFKPQATEMYYNQLHHMPINIQQIESSVKVHPHSIREYPLSDVSSTMSIHPKSVVMEDSMHHNSSNQDDTTKGTNPQLEPYSIQYYTGCVPDIVFASEVQARDKLKERERMHIKKETELLRERFISAMGTEMIGMETGNSSADTSISDVKEVNDTTVSRAPLIPNSQPLPIILFNQGDSVVPPYQLLQNNALLLKPLTPYNYFYRDERDNIVLQISGESDLLPPPVSDFSQVKMRHLLHQHWFIDPLKTKRIHRKTHGKISFERLSSTISERWRMLSSQGREFYRSVSKQDEVYYNQHMVKLLEQDSAASASTDRAQCMGNEEGSSQAEIEDDKVQSI